MIEKVNPSHPDKIADHIAGAIVDLAYRLQDDPKIAVEVLLGHGQGEPIEISCAIGDKTIESNPYIEIVEIAERFISNIGGFEKFAEWGLF